MLRRCLVMLCVWALIFFSGKRILTPVMEIVRTSVPLTYLRSIASKEFGIVVKAVVDVDRELMAINADMHADLERFLIENESNQHSLWGIYLWPEKTGDSFLELGALTNIRPRNNNFSRDVEDETVRARIRSIVGRLVQL